MGIQVQERTNESGGSAPLRSGKRIALSARMKPLAVSLLLFLLVLVVFWPATTNQFINFDDTEYVTCNTHVQSGLTPSSLRWAFRSTDTGNWHPLTWLSHILDFQIYGLSPRGHHLSSVLLHAANSALLFLVLRTMTAMTWPALLASVLWGLHPLRVESVAWVAERKDLLSACFGLLALWTYARHVNRGGQQVSSAGAEPERRDRKPQNLHLRKPQSATLPTSHISRITHASPVTSHPQHWYTLALVFFVLSLMSKPMLVTLPFVLLLLDFWPLCRLSFPRRGDKDVRIQHLLLEKLPFLGLTAVASLIALTAQSSAGSLEDRLSLPLRLDAAAISCCRYLWQTIYPADLCVYYPHPGFWPTGQVVAALSLLVGASGVALAFGRHRPYLATGWFWFLGTLIPVLGLVQIGGQAMADRYTYIPSIGLMILLAWSLQDLARWRFSSLLIWPLIVAASISCLFLNRRQIRFWQDSETLFRRALAVTEQNSLAHINLGDALLSRKAFEEAAGHFRLAVEIDPGSPQAHYNLGVALFRQGRLDESRRAFQTALSFKPAYQEAHYNLGVVLLRQGRLDEGIRELREAVRLNPEDADAQNGLRMALASKAGQPEPPVKSERP
jgi:protein O-mannosyl-transferase